MAKKKTTEELSFNAKSELVMGLMRLQKDAAFLYYLSIIGAWKNQALNDILMKEEAPKEKGEFTAYGRCENLIPRLISDLNNSEVEINLDAYKA